MRFILIIILSFSFCISYSQTCFPENKEEKRLVKKLEKHIEKGLFYNTPILEQYSSAIFYSLHAEVLWNRGQYLNAEKQALKAVKLCPDNSSSAFYFLADIAYKNKDFVNAVIYVEKALKQDLSNAYYSSAVIIYQNAKIIADIINNPVPYNPIVVDGVSTSFDEYLPVISPDQNFSFYTRRSEVVDPYAITSLIIEEFMVSTKENQFFSQGKPLPYPFNQGDNEGGASITIDNKTLYFTKCKLNNEGYNNCDIFYVINNNGIWSDIKQFPNTVSRKDSWESQPSVSSDGKKIIFASDRLGGFGKIDLYETNFINGQWSDPVNLGKNINSSENEKSPYLHMDGKTLFFASSNFPSIGGFDIFYSKKDTFGQWQKPINIGYPINSTSDEISLFVTTDGKQAYFASNNLDGYGGWDIYSFILHENARPERVLFLYGHFLDEEGSVVSGVELEVKNIKTQEINTFTVNDDGVYTAAITLADDADVLLTVKKEGYAFKSKYIKSSDTLFSAPSKLDFPMYSLDKSRSFIIDNIYFSNDSYELNKIAEDILLEFANYLKINNKLIIEINGFTDNIGNIGENQVLSENRARVVYQLLISTGISSDRISYNGFGESLPVSDNLTEEGRAKNRRTEFRVVSN